MAIDIVIYALESGGTSVLADMQAGRLFMVQDSVVHWLLLRLSCNQLREVALSVASMIPEDAVSAVCYEMFI